MAMDHSSCTHPRDPKGRAWCRANGGPGSGAVWGSASPGLNNGPVAEVAKVDTKVKKAREYDTSSRTRLVLASLPNTFRAAADWANAEGATVTTREIGDQKLVNIASHEGVLTLTWRPSLPEGVYAVAFRPVGTSVTRKLNTVNEGLQMLQYG